MKNAVFFSVLAGRHQRVKGKGKREISAREEGGRRRLRARNGGVLFDVLASLIISLFPSPSNGCLCRMLELSPIRCLHGPIVSRNTYLSLQASSLRAL